MARVGRPKADLVLSDEERVQLVRWARRRKSSQALALRSRIVLGCASAPRVLVQAICPRIPEREQAAPEPSFIAPMESFLQGNLPEPSASASNSKAVRPTTPAQPRP